MPDNSDNVLNVLIKLGVLGQADAQAAKQLLLETTEASEQLKGKMAESTDALSHYQSQNEGVRDAMGKTAEQTRDSVAAQLVLRQTLEKLDAAIPGFTSHLNQFTQGHQESAKAAVAGTMANESFLASLSPLAALMLTLQTAAEHWDKYKEHVQSAQETHSAALKQMEISPRSAPQTQPAFNLAVSGNPAEKPAKTDQPQTFREASDTAAPRLSRHDTSTADMVDQFTADASKTSLAQKNAINQFQNAFTIINGNTDNLLTAIKHGLEHQIFVQQEVQLIKRQLAALAAKSSQG